MAKNEYGNANGGQTYIPFQENIYVETLPFRPLERPNPELPEFEMKPEFLERGYILTMQCQHFIPDVTPEMMDWWWANMEKGYYLWAPGSHKRFSWVKEPWKYGMQDSAHMISESLAPGVPVFGGSGIQINRLHLDMFPFTTHLEHVLVEGIVNRLGEFVDGNVHMWEAVEGGIVHVTADFCNTRISEPPEFVLEDPNAKGKIDMAEESKMHSEYEASRFPIFLPKLYELWKGHPDPSQNVQVDLRVRDTADGGIEYIAENGPVVLNKK